MWNIKLVDGVVITGRLTLILILMPLSTDKIILSIAEDFLSKLNVMTRMLALSQVLDLFVTFIG